MQPCGFKSAVLVTQETCHFSANFDRLLVLECTCKSSTCRQVKFFVDIEKFASVLDFSFLLQFVVVTVSFGWDCILNKII